MLYQERENKACRVLSLFSMNRIHSVNWYSVHNESTGEFIRFEYVLWNGHKVPYDPHDDPTVAVAAALMLYDLPRIGAT